jgi:DNA-binding NarL/FixJ family response regulator
MSDKLRRRKMNRQPNPTQPNPTQPNPTMDHTLSAREFEVLELLSRGCKNRQIALALEIEECTVRFHVGNILSKFEVKNRTEAVCYAFRKGWITD